VDTIYGGKGTDTINGGEGHDTVYGGDHNTSSQDIIITNGGEGPDTKDWDGPNESDLCTQPTVNINDTRAVESDGYAEFLVRLNRVYDQDVSVTWQTANGSATQPTDYTTSSNTLVIAAGSTTGTISVPINNDTVDEGDEAFNVQITGVTNAELGDSSAACTIIDNDAPSGSMPLATVTSTQAEEGDVFVAFTVSLTQATNETVRIHFATSDGTATDGVQYYAFSEDIYFAPNQTSAEVHVSIQDDNWFEPGSSPYFFVTISSPVNALIGTSGGYALITDDDPAPTMSISDVLVTESDPGLSAVTAQFVVSMTNPASFSVNFTVVITPGTALATSDYSASTTTFNVTLPAGQTTHFITRPITADLVVESQEVFYATITSASVVVTDYLGVCTINDNDHEVDIDIHYGQNGRLVDEIIESGEVNDYGFGAFTVANLNDTDGDGVGNQKQDINDDWGLPADLVDITGGGQANTDQVTVSSVEGYSVGDWITIANLTEESERKQILGINSATKTLTLSSPLAFTYSNAGGRVLQGGVSERDLMEFKVHKPNPAEPSSSIVLTFSGPEVGLWTSQFKGPGTRVTLTNHQLIIPVDEISSLGLTYWIEAREISNHVRDIQVTATYLNATPDTVNATSVWSTLAGWVDTRGDALFDDMPQSLIEILADKHIDSMGLATPYVYEPLNTTNINNGIAFAFQTLPAGLANEPVEFDIARRVERSTWEKYPGEDWEILDTFFTDWFVDAPNDDNSDEDEVEIPNANDRIFSIDAPGWQGLIPQPVAGIERLTRFNAEEFVRVSFQVNMADNYLLGSRASAFTRWEDRSHIITFVEAAEPEPIEGWKRVTGDLVETATNSNSIGSTPIGWGPTPFPEP